MVRGTVTRRRIESERPHHSRIPKGNLAALDNATDPLAGHRLEIRRIAQCQALGLGALDDGLGKGMFRRFLQRRGKGQDRILALLAERLGVGQLWLALGQRAGLVDDQRVNPCHPLQRLGVLDQHTRLRTAPGGGRNRNRSCQPQSTGTGDDQDRDRSGNRVEKGRLGAEEEPANEGQQRHHHHGRHKDRRDLVGQALDRRARASGTRNHLDDLRQNSVGANLRSLHRKGAVLVDRAASHRVALGFFDRNRLACDHAFVDRGMAIDDDTIHRNAVAGPHAQLIAGKDVFQRHVMLAAVGQGSAPRSIRACSRSTCPAPPVHQPKLDMVYRL
ncbi:hypothetical protein GALL_484770 [mine drainage metagenome]|uniref:Uncharacterized protein n=1 Tax=mine drainage metagenome TaxID=410659 RepID=A0A1J5PQS0_9ZZZZ